MLIALQVLKTILHLGTDHVVLLNRNSVLKVWDR